MNRAFLFTWLMAALLVGAAGADSETKEIPAMTVGQTASGVTYKADRYKSYHLLSVPTIDKKYLFITVTAEEIYSHLGISLLIYKQGTQTPLQKCLKEEVDSCYVPRNILQVNETLFVVVQSDSEEEIAFKLNSYWSDLEHIHVNEEVRFMFSEQEQRQIYHLELEGQEFKELRVLIKPETRRYPFDKVKMYGSFGKDSNPTSQNHDFESFPLWEDAEGVYLFRSELKELTMNLILYGMTETVYTMKCWVSNKTHSDLPINSKIYEYLQTSQRYMYHLQFKDKEGKYYYENYVFRASIFNGDLQMKFYKDEQKKEEVTLFNPLMYMGDIQYILKQEQIDKYVPNGLYVEVSSDTRITTYMMEFEGRTKTEALELNEHIYEFLYVDKTERAYFKIGKYGTADKADNKGFKVTVSQIQVTGGMGLSFLLCTKVASACLGQNFANSTTPLEHEIRQVGTKKTYTFYMTQQMFENVNTVEQHAIIVVVLSNKNTEGPSLTAIEFNVGNRPEFLRENKPIESHVKKNELKLYKYVCQDPSVKKVKIHISTIAGGFQAFAFRNVPSEQELKNQAGRVMNGLVEITEDLMKDPVVIVINGADSATFSIVVQTITNIKDDWSYITLSEDVEFKARIAPNKVEIFEIIPIAASIYFDYKATGAVHVCRLNEDGVCADEGVPTLANSGDMKIEQFVQRKAYVRVSNPSSDRLVEVTTIFHSKKEDHCELIKVGELTREVFSEGKCLYSILHTLQDYEVMIVHEQLGKMQYKMLLCDKLLNIPHKENDQQRYYISKEMIKGNCQGHSDYTFTLFVIGDPLHLQNGKVVDPENLFIKFIVQPTASTMMLPDGLGYKGIDKTTELPVKKFAFKMLNKVDTSIIVTTRNKLYFLVKVIEKVYRDSTTMSLSDFHFSSPIDKYYFLDSMYLKIPSGELLKSTCSDCQLLIFLYSKEPVGEMVEYNIEVSQNFFMLEEGKKKQNFLTQYSKAFYGYKAKGEGMVIVEVSDNNMDCAELYISNKEYPDENNYIKRSYDGQLMLQNKKETPQTYYITVLARENCAYSIGANLAVGQRNLFKLERGILSHLSLKEGEVKYFTFKHLSESPFKILSLHKYGRVEMYLNQTNQEEVASFMTLKKVSYQDFQFRSEHKNRLLLNDTNRFFCQGCHYLLAVVAVKHTESSLYLGDEITKVPLSSDKVLNDILSEPSSTTRGEFYPMENGVLEVKVHSGKVEVTINYKDQEVKQIFDKLPEKQVFNISLNLVKGYYGTASISMRALLANTVYSLRIKQLKSSSGEEDTGTDYTTVNPEEANYIFVTDRLNCLKGYFKAKDQRIFVSFYSNDKKKLNQLQITGTLNGELTDISHDITRNVMSVAFIKAANMEFVKGVPFELCFSIPNQTLSAVVMQTQDVGTLPENVEMLVTGKQTYDIYPEGQFILDVFECRGTASVAYGTTKAELQNAKQKILDVVGISDQTHAVRIERGYFNMLLSVNSPLALIRWLPLSEADEKGMGYYLYSAGKLKYDSVFGQINFIVQPIQANKKKSKTKVLDIKYNLYVSNNEQDLKEAGLCERYLPGSVMEYRTIHEQINIQEFKFSVDKNVIMKKYTTKEELPENLFAMIVADLTLQTPDKSQQYYRFVYNQQEIPAELFKPSKMEQFEMIFIIVFLVVLTMTLFACAFLCTRVFVPMIARLKNRVLVEEAGLDNSKENKDEMKQQDLEPPPSSDRQNINVITAPQTEERMS